MIKRPMEKSNSIKILKRKKDNDKDNDNNGISNKFAAFKISSTLYKLNWIKFR
jgi:hypothetical protein